MIPKVLLVDDVTMFLELQKMFLKLSSVHVLTARNGIEAIEVARKERPALIFMDLHMPGMNGDECRAAIKADPELKSVPVIMLTSEGKIGDQALCYKSGCNGFLTKPLDRLQYLETARKYLPAIDRRDPRVPCRTKVKFRAYGVTLSGEAMNISTNGIFVVADYDVEVGTVLDLVFALPDETQAQIQTKGRVAWLNSAKGRLKDGLPGGFGVEFVAITEESRESLRQYVRKNS
ncbi:MAG TPA: response regulator [Geobacteraceae bacterium]|nr:response regulator [Geobacteraceae bacterium]